MELRVEGLTKRYGKKDALLSFHYVFTQGIYGILGENGAGKSTLMGILTDNINRTEGKILLDGTEVLKLGKNYRAMIGYMPQESGIYGQMTGREFLEYMSRLKGIHKKPVRVQIDELLKMVHLEEAANEKSEQYSGGMKQRLLLAQALLGDPQILILDEPTAGLDLGERIRFREFLKSYGKDRVILYSTHIMEELQDTADNVLLIKKGCLIQSDTVENLMLHCNGKSMEDIYLYYWKEQSGGKDGGDKKNIKK